METLGNLYHVSTSKTAQRTAIDAALLIGASISLFCFAGVASWLFYHSYLPDQIVSSPIYLQYGSGANPYGVVTLHGPKLKERQDYDVSVTLSVPRSPANLELGNFMVALHFVTAVGSAQEQSGPDSPSEPYEHFNGKSVIFSSRRPVLIPYEDPFSSVGRKLLFFLYHVLLPASQTSRLVIPMVERLQFQGPSTIPASIFVEVQAGQTLEVYWASVTMAAQLRGLRWLMVHYRLTTFATLTTLFWLCEVSFMCIGWLLWSNWDSARLEPGPASARDGGLHAGEREGMIEAVAPHIGHTGPRHDIRTKEEDHGGSPRGGPVLKGAGADADDEDGEDEDGGAAEWKHDSGVGFSDRDGQGSGHLRKRLTQQQR